ncbi:hypothetical protein HBH56_024520 [Parastagonospora nodorum]|uniref:Uncharacterized protein n=1 Tax=Phaeosphaeria nodorum (strain SN15 / ATCC MYA-4574 / FGSC 10173) TaxID=321614 RepID=A0A7U2I1X0_PHANO|nr:hypothetical protein HBH56_024520 [Parastagonospora nodorum]QRC98803.1 hypothetical protein JI435_412570 [Parastagonospora nodorum SN15]KAH3934254.1 hypothetical protein HBH54_057490 [Parastagonospora nodorum]KAH3949727.1 hypothetical protein HBH53_085180 [Parastagonospora nodorum]KAH4039330.1 hypothetical protein HBI09_046900 [Parastagonospora nodorum]
MCPPVHYQVFFLPVRTSSCLFNDVPSFLTQNTLSTVQRRWEVCWKPVAMFSFEHRIH